MTITREWLRAHRTRFGGYTREQLAAIWVPWPPKHGWVEKAIGLEIPESQQRIFEQGASA